MVEFQILLRHSQRHAATRFCVLHRVVEQLEQHFLHPQKVHVDHAVVNPRPVDRKPECLRLRLRQYHPLKLRQQLVQLDNVFHQIHLARLHARDLERLIHDREQLLARSADLVQIIVDPRLICLVFPRKLRKTDDRIERCPYIV